jgi:RNA polymerase sigma-70 factor (ECF subfamily)
MDPDTQRMLRFQKGERAAFEMLFEKYHRPILNFCFRFLGNTHDAEDTAQDTFIQVYQAAPRYQPLTKFSTWLYTIAKNLCLNKLRKGQNPGLEEINPPMDDLDRDPAEAIVSDYPGPDQELEQKELSEIVQKAVLDLPLSMRLPLILRRYQELSYEEIAQILGCSVTAVKLRLHRAKGILAQRLGPYIKPD